jgi:hypothetical protein
MPINNRSTLRSAETSNPSGEVRLLVNACHTSAGDGSIAEEIAPEAVSAHHRTRPPAMTASLGQI